MIIARGIEEPQRNIGLCNLVIFIQDKNINITFIYLFQIHLREIVYIAADKESMGAIVSMVLMRHNLILIGLNEDEIDD